MAQLQALVFTRVFCCARTYITHGNEKRDQRVCKAGRHDYDNRMSQAELQLQIILRSEAKAWSEAKKEWRLKNIWLSDDPETCLCGHHPIKEICEIENPSVPIMGETVPLYLLV